MSPYGQHGYRVRFDWGLRGALECAPGSAVVAVVDVLSFTTTVGVGVEHGIEVLPYRWRDDTARAYAAARGADLAVGRSEAGPGQVSLSPQTFRTARGVPRVVLPSPNGSTVTSALTDLGCRIVAVSLRNATAAARWAVDTTGADGIVTAIAAGEHWPDSGLRPAVEDLWGAGAFLAALLDAGAGPPSPEAATAATAIASVRDVPAALADCASGRELIGYGYAGDVAVAAERDVTDVVPVLVGEAFTAAR